MRFPVVIVACVAIGGLALAARPAAAQWSRVISVPVTSVYALFQRGDTLVAGATNVVYVSVNGGASFTASATIGTGSLPITAVRFERGRLYAGSYGQGVFASTNLGATWQSDNAGLSGGIVDSQRFVTAFEVRGDSLYAGTGGAGTYVRDLATLGNWSVFGPSIVSDVSGNVSALAGEGPRLLAAADANGGVNFNDRGQPDWTVSDLESISAAGVGQQVDAFAWTGTAWLASTFNRVYRSTTGSEGWQRVGPPIVPHNSSRVASNGPRTFVAFSGFADCTFFFSADGGSSWTPLETVPAVVLDMVVRDTLLFAGRTDGLWLRTDVTTAGVAGPAGSAGVRFALAGANPARGRVPLDFTLPAATRVRVRAYDVTGRALGTIADAEFPSGPHSLTWNAAALPAGVYLLRLETPGAARQLRVAMLR